MNVHRVRRSLQEAEGELGAGGGAGEGPFEGVTGACGRGRVSRDSRVLGRVAAASEELGGLPGGGGLAHHLLNDCWGEGASP